MAVSHSAFSASHAEQALRFVGKSTDAKPGEAGCKYPAPPNASTFYEMDGTNRFWMYDAEDRVWVLQNTGGGPGPSITIDPTLSIPGAAADAKAVGDKMVWKPEDYVEGDLAALDSEGKIYDSGISANDVTNKVDYSIAQTLTDTQKAQARDNIAAAGQVEVEPLINQWDEQLEGGSYNTSTGAKETATQICRSKNKIKVNGNTAYYFNLTDYNNYNAFFWNSNNQFISASAAKTSNGVITTPENAAYMAFQVWKNGSSWGTTPPTVSWSINYPATYTGYYPANYSVVKNSLGKLGNAIIRGGWNQLATPNCINKSMTASGSDTEYLFNFDAVNGHKYYFVIDLSRAATQSGNHDFQFYWQGAWTSYHIDGTVKHRSMIVTASASGTQRVIFGTYNDYQGNLTLNYINLIDLTEIFGAGNEPTIEQLKQLFPDDYYPFATPGFGDLLWENAAPASAFALQLVAVDLSQYKWVLVRCFVSTTDTYYITPMILSTADNKDAFIATHFTGTNVRRQVGVRPTGVNFGTCYDGSNSDNAKIIPYQIYGIR